jgi:cation:H+ antiporter
VWFLLGLATLVLGAEALVRGASRLSHHFGISPLVVGLTIVAFGTSAPEFAVTVKSVYAGQPEIALGNVVGSNIFNVLFILGLSALLVPLLVDQQLVRLEVPLSIGISLLLLALAHDGKISRLDGAVLALVLAGYSALLIRRSRRETTEVKSEYSDAVGPKPGRDWEERPAIQVLLVIGGLVLLVVGARWLVDAATDFARLLGISELVVGLTIVAAGTSFPELATSLVAALRGQRDIAVGNVLGSNIFNILGVLGISAVVAPNGGLPVMSQMLVLDLPVMVAVAIACLPVFFTGHLIARWEGGLFLSFYVLYVAYLIASARHQDLDEQLWFAIGAFLVPIALVTLFVFAWRQRQQSQG